LIQTTVRYKRRGAYNKVDVQFFFGSAFYQFSTQNPQGFARAPAAAQARRNTLRHILRFSK